MISSPKSYNLYACRFKNSFDLDTFKLLKDNGDGTALFYIEDDLFGSSNYVLPEARAFRYPWSEMLLTK